jgi:hypothetical protein
MQAKTPLMVVAAWLEAVNRQEVDHLLELSAHEIEIVGPRGVGHGHQLLREWLKRAGAQFETEQTFARDQHVVVAQHGVWRSPETGEVIGQADVASLFRVDGGRVTHYARYDRLDEALEKAGLVGSDEPLGSDEIE